MADAGAHDDKITIAKPGIKYFRAATCGEPTGAGCRFQDAGEAKLLSQKAKMMDALVLRLAVRHRNFCVAPLQDKTLTHSTPNCSNSKGSFFNFRAKNYVRCVLLLLLITLVISDALDMAFWPPISVRKNIARRAGKFVLQATQRGRFVGFVVGHAASDDIPYAPAAL